MDRNHSRGANARHDRQPPQNPTSSNGNGTSPTRIPFPQLALRVLIWGLLLWTGFSQSVSAASPPSLPEGFIATQYAAPNLLANPVAIALDRTGKVYVAEAHRKNSGVWGVTFSRWWAMEDYQHRTLADRTAMYERWAHIVPENELTRASDLIRVLEDRDQDGTADHSQVFSAQFQTALEGNAAGLLAQDGTVWLGNVPNLWQLRDTDNDGQADVRRVLHTGFGVRVGVHGHDLHGLVHGPDGKLYFTIGDRGYDAILGTGERKQGSHEGAVFRCNPDGSNLECYHTGLRNPQELAFNDAGDLFTVDNNMSGGDECRILHLFEGGDSGWDAGYQLSGHFRDETQRLNHPQPPWFTERLWAPPHEEQPRWHTPAVANLSRGPSGLAHYPGSGLPVDYADHFFLADFVGSPTTSGVLAFQLEPSGATYRLDHEEQFAWGRLITDIAFTGDGSLYLSDWITGWNGEGEGIIWRIQNPDSTDKETAALLKSGTDSLSNEALARQLRHPDRRVRLQAQFALAKKGSENALTTLLDTLQNEANPLARRHALWGLGQRYAQNSNQSIIKSMTAALADADSEVRAQAAKVLGDLPQNTALPNELLERIQDPVPRVRYHALLAAAKHGLAQAVAPAIRRLARDKHFDPALFHATSQILFRGNTVAQNSALARHPDAAVRHAAVVALRRAEAAGLTAFLEDPDRAVRFEVVRAIHDLPIPAALPAVAALADAWESRIPELPFPIAQRIVNANYRLGQFTGLKRLSRMAADVTVPITVRSEALGALEHWDHPTPFDRVTWQFKPHHNTRYAKWTEVVANQCQEAYRSLSQAVSDSPSLKSDSPLRTALARAARILSGHGWVTTSSASHALNDPQLPSEIRHEFLQALIHQGTFTSDWASNLLTDPSPAIQATAAAWLAEQGEPRGWTHLSPATAGSSVPRLQAALGQLARLHGPQATATLESYFSQAATLPAGAWLELAEAAQDHTGLEARLQGFQRHVSEQTALGTFGMALEGGDPEQGERLFKTHVAQCIRCHQIAGFGGKAGPDLSAIGRQQNRRGILEALVTPNKRIAEGYGTTTIDTDSGETYTGTILSENAQAVTLKQSDGTVISLPIPEIEFRSQAQSAMPPMGDVLTLKELRHLVAFLSAQQ